MAWLDDLIFGIRSVFSPGGVEMPQRSAIQFVGATVEDDGANARTKVTVGSPSVGGAVQNFVALRGIAAADRVDKQTRLVEDADSLFRFDDDTGAGVADDGVHVIRPDDVLLASDGRWYRVPGPVTGSAPIAVAASSEEYGGWVVSATFGATPSTVEVGDAADGGTTAQFARIDHVHRVDSPGAPANVTKTAADAGASAKVAREDHKHDVSTAAPAAGAVAIGNAASEGSATSLARSDHVHAVSGGSPVDIATSGSDGAAATFARSDHVHGTPAKLRTNTACWRKDSTDAAPGDATAELAFFRAPVAITIVSVWVVPDAALIANDTDFATLLVNRRDADGTNQANVVTRRTQTSGSGGTGDWVAFAAEDLGTISNAALAAGKVLTFEITKAGAGVRVPSSEIVVEYTID